MHGEPGGVLARLLHDASVDAGFDTDRVRIADDEPHAVRQVLDSAEAGDLVVITADEPLYLRGTVWSGGRISLRPGGYSLYSQG